MTISDYRQVQPLHRFSGLQDPPRRTLLTILKVLCTRPVSGVWQTPACQTDRAFNTSHKTDSSLRPLKTGEHGIPRQQSGGNTHLLLLRKECLNMKIKYSVNIHWKTRWERWLNTLGILPGISGGGGAEYSESSLEDDEEEVITNQEGWQEQIVYCWGRWWGEKNNPGCLGMPIKRRLTPFTDIWFHL